MTTTINDWLFYARNKLNSISDSPSSDAVVLLKNLLRVNRTWIALHPQTSLSNQQINRLERELGLVCQGYPLPYITACWEFFGLQFLITPAVLIPRPETELLVEQAIQWLKEHPQATHILDIGTGSGCIPISIAKYCPDRTYYAADVSQSALQIAQINILSHQMQTQIQLIQSDVFDAFRFKFDLICSNPPYIPTQKLNNLKVSRWEPRLALDGGTDGLCMIRKLISQLHCFLKTPGVFLCEIEETLSPQVLRLAHEFFQPDQVEILEDLSQSPRLLKICL